MRTENGRRSPAYVGHATERWRLTCLASGARVRRVVVARWRAPPPIRHPTLGPGVRGLRPQVGGGAWTTSLEPSGRHCTVRHLTSGESHERDPPCVDVCHTPVPVAAVCVLSTLAPAGCGRVGVGLALHARRSRTGVWVPQNLLRVVSEAFGANFWRWIVSCLLAVSGVRGSARTPFGPCVCSRARSRGRQAGRLSLLTTAANTIAHSHGYPPR